MFYSASLPYMIVSGVVFADRFFATPDRIYVSWRSTVSQQAALHNCQGSKSSQGLPARAGRVLYESAPYYPVVYTWKVIHQADRSPNHTPETLHYSYISGASNLRGII